MRAGIVSAAAASAMENAERKRIRDELLSSMKEHNDAKRVHKEGSLSAIATTVAGIAVAAAASSGRQQRARDKQALEHATGTRRKMIFRSIPQWY